MLSTFAQSNTCYTVRHRLVSTILASLDLSMQRIITIASHPSIFKVLDSVPRLTQAFGAYSPQDMRNGKASDTSPSEPIVGAR